MDGAESSTLSPEGHTQRQLAALRKLAVALGSPLPSKMMTMASFPPHSPTVPTYRGRPWGPVLFHVSVMMMAQEPLRRQLLSPNLSLLLNKLSCHVTNMPGPWGSSDRLANRRGTSRIY